jgi:2,3-bisphosphoglycerate-independent phosphoglycerate mutase
LDTCLRNYVASLGKGVTVVIYGDHPTEVARGDFSPSRNATGEYVPVFIYDTDRNLADLQKTHAEFAESGKLKLIDISSYLRNQINLSWPATKSHLETRR